MDFGLSDEQMLLRDTARSFVERVCPPEVAKDWDDTHTTPPELFSGMAELGWFGMPFPEALGGGGGDVVDLVVIAEELGRASLDVAMCYSGTLIGGLLLARWGSPGQQSGMLTDIMNGKARLAIGMSEPDAGSDAAALRTSAVPHDGGFLVNGQKMWCTGAGVPATTIATYVRTDRDAPKHQGLSLLLIDPTSDGVELRRIPTLARHILGTYEVFLRDVVVPSDALVGPRNGGWQVMLSGLEIERVLMCGGYVGAAQATFDEALAYSKAREQFGRPVGTFQAIAHDLADLQTEIDAARLLAYRAAWLLSQGRDCSREGAMAKLKCSETYVAAARLGMQILAGHGFATESVMSFRWRESIVATISAGTSQIQRNGIARSMGLRTY